MKKVFKSFYNNTQELFKKIKEDGLDGVINY